MYEYDDRMSIIVGENPRNIIRNLEQVDVGIKKCWIQLKKEKENKV